MRSIVLSLIATAALGVAASAQSPMPVIVPAMTPAATVAVAVTHDNGSFQAAIKLLQQMKATNEEILRKQAATLEQLDAIEKAANEIKIYTKRS
jgi:hypothetical protein